MALIYFGILLLGGAPLLMRLSPAWQAAGVGLWFPGAGFLADGGWAVLLLPVTLALFALALALERLADERCGDAADLRDKRS
jgi:hypothetical protein